LLSNLSSSISAY